MAGTLYLVATPIGNLGDITLRALDTLKAVDCIACEDTRHSATLLAHYDIHKPTMSYYMHKERESGAKIIDMLIGGKNIALITDAGMPCVSDPGAILVAMAREQGIDIRVIPGASAVVSAMALSGITRRGFCFLGFLPEKNKDKEALLYPYKDIDIQLVFYCSPHGINTDLADLYRILGDRKVVIVKEISKMFERVEEGDLASYRLEQPRGEYVVILEGKPYVSQLIGLSIKEHIESYLMNGMSKKNAVKTVAKERGMTKDDVYQVAIDMQDCR